jgi:hypothetical protein
VIATFFILPFSSAALEVTAERVFPLKLFITVAGIAFFLLLLGFSQELPYFNIAASVLIFFLGYILLNGSLAYTDGTMNKNFIYGDNFTYNYNVDNEMNTTTVLLIDNTNLINSTETPVYTYWDNSNSFLLGFLLMFLGVVFFATTLFSLARGGDEY